MRAKPLSKADIERAMAMTRSNKAAARYLHVSYIHYKGYAKNFTDENGVTLFDKHKNQAGKGISKFLPNRGKQPPLQDILEGRISVDSYTPEKLKERLIQESYIQETCAICGFSERRVTDYKVPLLLNFLDGNKKNWSLDNLQMLCYNHYFLNVGNIFTNKQLQHIEDYNPPPTSTQAVEWEMDDWYKEHFVNLGLIDKDKEDGEEFVSKL
jgi:hypothetical protein